MIKPEFDFSLKQKSGDSWAAYSRYDDTTQNFPGTMILPLLF